MIVYWFVEQFRCYFVT